jgi:hypothetical protein
MLRTEAVAVAVAAGRGEAEDRVALGDRGAVDQPVALDDADAEADQLDLALGVDAGHRRGLAAEQRAARAPAALGHPAQRLPCARALELRHRHVVEEHQRLGALDHEVVHHHRHAVDPDRVEPVELGGQLELRADRRRRSPRRSGSRSARAP